MKNIIPAKHVVVRDFLPTDINQYILEFILNNQHQYTQRRLSPEYPYQKGFGADNGFNDWQNYMIGEINLKLPNIQNMLDINIKTSRVESHVSAHSDQGFLGIHNDTFCAPSRVLSYVYYIHAMPRPFIGGQLVIYDSEIDNFTLKVDKADSCHIVEPENNTCVFFNSCCYHQVLPVACSDFSKSRFSMNGWIHQ
jgi:Rps23 Pro-64 3,4-dihydroxylase Tpa1-like proline 4-hydroxylase